MRTHERTAHRSRLFCDASAQPPNDSPETSPFRFCGASASVEQWRSRELPRCRLASDSGASERRNQERRPTDSRPEGKSNYTQRSRLKRPRRQQISGERERGWKPKGQARERTRDGISALSALDVGDSPTGSTISRSATFCAVREQRSITASKDNTGASERA